MSTLNPPSITARTQLLLEMARSTASLRIPPEVPGGPQMRERLVAESALMSVVEKLIGCNPHGTRWLTCFAHAIIAYGREQGAEFDEIIAEIADATRQAVEARAKHEAKERRKPQ